MDLVMPGVGGLEATRRLIDQRPDLGILVLTMSEDDASVFAALRAGARGYVLKGTGGGDFLAAVTAVSKGEAVYGPAVARRIRSFLATGPGTGPFPELDPAGAARSSTCWPTARPTPRSPEPCSSA